MARLVPLKWALKKAKKRELNAQAGVKWNGDWYVIWRDEVGPIYSSKATIRQIRAFGGSDFIYMDDGLDTITERTLYRTDAVLG